MKFKFSHKNKWFMHNPQSVLENGMHELRLIFEIQTHHLILARQPDLVVVGPSPHEKSWVVNFAVPPDNRVKLREGEKKDKYLDLVRVVKTLWKLKGMVIPVVIGALGNVTKGLVKGWEE